MPRLPSNNGVSWDDDDDDYSIELALPKTRTPIRPGSTRSSAKAASRAVTGLYQEHPLLSFSDGSDDANATPVRSPKKKSPFVAQDQAGRPSPKRQDNQPSLSATHEAQRQVSGPSGKARVDEVSNFGDQSHRQPYNEDEELERALLASKIEADELAAHPTAIFPPNTHAGMPEGVSAQLSQQLGQMREQLSSQQTHISVSGDSLDESDDESDEGGDDAEDRGQDHFVFPTKLKKATIKTWTLGDLHRGIKSGEIDLDVEYQRDVVWPEKRMIALVGSLIQNYYVPPVLFHCSNTQGNLHRTCVDGKQRLSSVVAFLDGKIPVEDKYQVKWFFRELKDASGKIVSRKRKLLDADTKQYIRRLELIGYDFAKMDDSQERDLFRRVQMGMPLTKTEQYQALSTPWTHFVSQLVLDFPDVANCEFSLSDLI